MNEASGVMVGIKRFKDKANKEKERTVLLLLLRGWIKFFAVQVSLNWETGLSLFPLTRAARGNQQSCTCTFPGSLLPQLDIKV
jgi:hypothetical protein